VKKRINLGLALGVLLSFPAYSQDARELVGKATQLYLAGNYDGSADKFEAAIKAGATSPTVFYNAACSCALSDRVDSAFRWLESALDQGYRDIEHLRSDKDFKALHKDERWGGMIKKCAKLNEAYLKTLKHPQLQLELLEMKRIDQEIRTLDHETAHQGEHGHDERHEQPREEHGEGHEHKPSPSSAKLHVHGSEMRDVDSKHTARMKEIVAEYGWPTKSMVGEQGATAAWLLVQHADADPKFQRHCLALMKKAAPEEVSPKNLAYLTDRVLVNEGKNQLYGTQFFLEDGKMVPQPIDDEANLDERRKEAGLMPMSEYTKHMTNHDH